MLSVLAANCGVASLGKGGIQGKCNRPGCLPGADRIGGANLYFYVSTADPGNQSRRIITAHVLKLILYGNID